MQISNDDLEEFKALYAAEFGKELSDEDASEFAGRVADLYTLLAETLPSEQERLPTQLSGEPDSPSPL